MNSLYYSLCIAILLLCSCNPTVKGPITQTEMITDSIVKTIISDFPQDVTLLLPTQYRKNSQGYPIIKGKQWLELYKDKHSKKWMIDTAEMQVKYGMDECVGEEILILSSKRQQSIAYFTSFPGISENVFTILEEELILPNTTKQIKIGTTNYQLEAKGKVVNEEGEKLSEKEVKLLKEDDFYDYRIEGYDLLLKTENGVVVKLLENASFNYTISKILWCGDLNGDEIPDLILDVSNFYESEQVIFFLVG